MALTSRRGFYVNILMSQVNCTAMAKGSIQHFLDYILKKTKICDCTSLASCCLCMRLLYQLRSNTYSYWLYLLPLVMMYAQKMVTYFPVPCNSGAYIEDSAITSLHKGRSCFLEHTCGQTCKLNKLFKLLHLAITGQ